MSIASDPLVVHTTSGPIEITPVAELEVLGTVVGPSSDSAVEHRLAKGMASFWSQKEVYLCHHIPAHTRFAEFRRRVFPVVLYGSLSWVVSKSLLQRLITWENVLLRRIFRLARARDEPWSTYVQRHTQQARAAYHNGGGCSLVYEYLKKLYMSTHRILISTGEALLRSLSQEPWPAHRSWSLLFGTSRHGRTREEWFAAACFSWPSFFTGTRHGGKSHKPWGRLVIPGISPAGGMPAGGPTSVGSPFSHGPSAMIGKP